MVSKSMIGAVSTCLAVVSINAGAAIVSTDWQTAGDNLITQDTTSGLEWLDVTETAGRSYNDISAKLGAGQEFEGWRYATSVELSGFWDAFGGNSAYYNGWSTQNNGLFDAIAPFWGDVYCAINSCPVGDGNQDIIIADSSEPGFHYVANAYDFVGNAMSVAEDFFSLKVGVMDDGSYFEVTSSALVRDVSAVPVPAAVWLFGSGLIGLIGLASRKKA